MFDVRIPRNPRKGKAKNSFFCKRELRLDFGRKIRYNNTVLHTPVCRNGRRGGLKIPCANNTCGFDPHHRHKQAAWNRKIPGCVFCCKSHLCVLWENAGSESWGGQQATQKSCRTAECAAAHKNRIVKRGSRGITSPDARCRGHTRQWCGRRRTSRPWQCSPGTCAASPWGRRRNR